MKKLSLIFVLFVCVAFVSSCHKQSYKILEYQDKQIEAICTLNDTYKIKIQKENGRTCVAFLEPKELCTIEFEIEGDSLVGRAGELEIPIKKESANGIFAIASIFSLDKETLTQASAKGGYSYMEFISSLGTYKLCLGENNLPKSVEITSSAYQFNITVDAISLK